MNEPPGPLLGTGRTADVFDLGDGRVLRRYRNGFDATGEAEVMRWVRARGVPVPEVFDADGTDLVMERVDGPTLLGAGAAKPWTIPACARTLADLHRRVHAVEAPAVVRRQVGEGRSLLHLDLHPLNVLVGPDGPVIIDWVNAAVGDPAYDVAYAWMVLAAADPPPGRLERVVSRIGRGVFLRAFLAGLDRAAAAAVLGALGPAGLVTVEHFSDAELRRMADLIESDGTPRPPDREA